MTTREELERLREGDKILIHGKEEKFLYLAPQQYDRKYCVIATCGESDYACYTLEDVEVPELELKRLGYLFLCVKPIRNYKRGLIYFDENFCFDTDHFKSITVNEKGEVFEVVE